ncbi:bifunctional diguanylate cyclase/phosphodiesterase [Marinimicrobium alkaliphilum]|uniref:bifunctional diguanylate cyclase/phosphodiesterase n=1 Tax=Marinimicrobium alkaliphilum TaxID=2202654 RepID=UPI000DBA8477|nr:EAL domain-containing protein [Marinimicrobium alkaliphilum]
MKLLVNAEEAFQRLANSVSNSGAEDFFSALVRCLGEVLAVDYVVISELGADRSEAQTLSVWSTEGMQPNFHYALAGTPCALASRGEVCVFSEGVQARFPSDELLAEMGIESFVGLGLSGPEGEIVGIINLLSRQPSALPGVSREVIRIAASQAGAELARRQAYATLNRNEARLNTLLNHLPGTVYRCRSDKDWSIEFVSEGCLALTGYAPEDFTSGVIAGFAALVHPDDLERVVDEVQNAMNRRQPYELTYRLITKAGEQRWAWEQGQAMVDEETQEVLLEGFLMDVTERHESEQMQRAVVRTATAITSRAGQDFFRQLLQHLVQALDADCAYIATLEPSSRDLLETRAVVIDGRVEDNFVYSLSGTPCAEILAKGECQGDDNVPIPLPAAPGKDSDWACSYVGRRLDDNDGRPIGVLMVMFRRPIRDYSFATSVIRILASGAAGELERETSQQRIQQLAYVDPITGLPNRIQFMEQLNELVIPQSANGKPLALVFIDIRRFKEVNDLQGHHVGDQLLRQLGQQLRHILRPGEFLARLAGDEFALLVPGCGASDVSAVVVRIQSALAWPIRLDDREYTLSANLGVARYPADAQTPGALFQCASVALHQAKQEEHGVCVFAKSMTENLSRRQQLTERFVQALNRNQLELYYQPQVDLKTGRMTGAEALCRWHDQEWGWVSPGEFIPLAEERGLMPQLGNWVLNEACRQLQAWADDGYVLPGRLSVNISAHQFDDDHLLERIQRITQAHEVEPKALSLELTESSLMRNPEQAVATTEALSAAGYGLSIDDFGTGYSSLSYLKRFAADTLKIDMSFVRDMLEDSHDNTIVTTIIVMARSLGMKTIAEGVETQAQAEALYALGCEQAQGFFYGRPVSEREFRKVAGPLRANESGSAGQSARRG